MYELNVWTTIKNTNFKDCLKFCLLEKKVGRVQIAEPSETCTTIYSWIRTENHIATGSYITYLYP